MCGSPSRSGSRRFDCVLRLGPIRDETLIAARWANCAMVNAASPAYLRALVSLIRLKIFSVRDIGQFTFRRCWAQDPMDGNPDGDSYATLQLPGALHVNSAQTYEAAAVAGIGLIQAPLLGIGRYRAWSACAGHSQVYSPGARRSSRRGPSEQPVAPCSRIHDMDRRFARALPRIAR